MASMTLTVTRTTTDITQGPVHYDEEEFREWVGHSNPPSREEMVEFIESDMRSHWRDSIEDVTDWKTINTETEYELS